MKGDSKRKTAGILGGMGPEATVDLLSRIIRHTNALDDEDHVRCIVDQNGQVPSRIKFLIEETGPSPEACLVEMSRNLEKAGADFLCIACNTAHHWHGAIENSVGIPVLNMPKLAAEAVRKLLISQKNDKDFPNVGIVASPAVRIAKVYEKACSSQKLNPLYADAWHESLLLSIIKRIKAGDTGDKTQRDYASVIEYFTRSGADAIIIACTELGVLPVNTVVPSVDAAEALAEATVSFAGAALKTQGG